MTMSGYIYAIAAEGSASVKIGCTRTDVDKRLAQLQTGSADRLSILAAVAVPSNLFAIEGAIHAALAAYRLAGEWFTCPITPARLTALVAEAQAMLTRMPDPGAGTLLAAILAQRTLSTSRKMLLIALACEGEKANGDAAPSLRHLAALTSLSFSSVCALLSDLAQSGYIRIERGRGQQGRNVYTINRARLSQEVEGLAEVAS
jgi:DNA-binding MarR family transcriptional regulator